MSGTPRADGFSMPPEFGPHRGTLMAWPTRESLWGRHFDRAKDDYAAVARAVASFEPVTMVCAFGAAAEVRNRCGEGVEPLELPIDDSWIRDNGPIFVSNDRGEVAMVHFRFNSWGEKYLPYDQDARLPALLAHALGVRRYEAPMVLEGGSFFVDGEGTLLTTEQCLLHPNRNPDLSREEIEDLLCTFLGAEKVVWLPFGMAEDRDTDGHVDGVAQLVRPGTALLLCPKDPSDPDAPRGRANAERLATERDARGRPFEVIGVPVTASVEVEGYGPVSIPYLNFYLVNGGVIVPTGGVPQDEEALALIRSAFPDREAVPVPGAILSFGGGGPHCITQQIPDGRFVA
ncbi:MAG TPA: agmatine deiminase family protein [Actinomycetota bacterium]|nr:agmatine deiminase family protein [Actinomycetota bacterium]